MFGGIDETDTVRRACEEVLASGQGFENAGLSFLAEIVRQLTLLDNEADQSLGLMGIELIHHEDPLRLRIREDGGADMLSEVLLGASLADCGSNHQARGHLEVGDQGLSPMA